MSTPALPPTAATTLVILLGASTWPNSPGFQASKAFVHAASGFRDYLLDPHGFGLSKENLLDQFDEQSGVSDQLEVLGSFLEQRAQELSHLNQAARDVLIYFVGHGGFAGPSADFYLLLRRTNASSLRSSGLSIDALAERLLEHARQTRRYLFLDCCFAAAAFRAFQGGPDQTAVAKTLDAFGIPGKHSGFPRKGVGLLCSSDQKSPSLLLPDESCTMFTSALLDTLRNGDLHRPEMLSLRDIKELAQDRLAALPGKNAPRPGLYPPDQSEGDVADIPFFRNISVERERVRQAEEEQRRLTEEAEQVHKAEEERFRQAKEAQQREIEAEQARLEERVRRNPAFEAVTVLSEGFSGSTVSLLPVPTPRLAQSRRTRSRSVLFTYGLALLAVLSGSGLLYFVGFLAQRIQTLSLAQTATAVATAQTYVTATAKKGVMFGFDAAHTHNNPYEHMLNSSTISRLSPLWSFPIGNSIYPSSSPAVAGGLVYVGSTDHKLYVFDATCRKSCQPLWSFTTGDGIACLLTIADGTVYIVPEDGKLYAFGLAS